MWFTQFFRLEISRWNVASRAKSAKHLTWTYRIALKQSNIPVFSKISILWLLFYLEYIGHSELSHIKHLSEVLKPNKIWKFLTKFDIWRDHGLWVVTKSYSPKLGEQLGGRLRQGLGPIHTYAPKTYNLHWIDFNSRPHMYSLRMPSLGRVNNIRDPRKPLCRSHIHPNSKDIRTKTPALTSFLAH